MDTMTLRNRNRLAAGGLTLLLALPALADPPAPAADTQPLTLEQIMADPDWIGNPPEEPYWSDDGRSVYYLRQREGVGNQRRDLYKVDLATGKAAKIDPAAQNREDAPGERNRERTWKTWRRAGDIWVKDLKTGKARQVTRTSDVEGVPHFLADGRRIWFPRGDTQYFVYDTGSGLLSQVADLKTAKDPADKEPSRLAEEQTRLFDVIRQKQEREKREREEDKTLAQADPTRPPQPWYLGEDFEIALGELSPAGDWLAVVLGPKAEEGKGAKMPKYVTESGNVETADVRAKVGIEKPAPHSVILLDLKNRERHDLDFADFEGMKDDPLKALREAAKARKATKKDDAKKDEAEKKDDDAKPSPRPLEVQELDWSDDGHQLALVLRARDNKDRWIATVDAASAKVTPRHRLTDPGWINWDFNELGWLRDNETLWFLSEESGYSQLYSVSTRTGETRRLSPEGKYEVSQPARSWDGRHVYYRANREHPGKYDIWRVEAATGKAEQLTKVGGLTQGWLSPDEDRLLLLHSEITRPDELFVQPNRPGGEARQVTETRTPFFLAQDWAMPEIVAIPSTHGAGPVYTRVFTPKDFDATRKYPAVMFVHGAGYLQEVTYGWSNYFREFMFHTLLSRAGYVVIDMDYRASAGYGRDWRTAIYRQMGTPELEDFQDGVAWLAANKNVDPARVGVYGGSYGGFMTFMALFRAPDLFAAGAALRPVTDWAHYNEDYTSNILNRPEVDPEAYEKSSPIEYAAGLTKPLLICHGMQDQNVFFQDTVRLVQRLIELKKENFETAFYPVEDHGFVQPTSWLDEYRRIFKLFEAHLK
jgi:dipeptidyl aminopeptidase/acylaminoacyl peptidase